MLKIARREQRSLFGEILDWMLAPLLLLWPMSVVLTWLVAQGIANRPYDRELADMVRVLSKQVAIAASAGTPTAVFTLPAGASAGSGSRRFVSIRSTWRCCATCAV